MDYCPRRRAEVAQGQCFTQTISGTLHRESGANDLITILNLSSAYFGKP
jgi:hypothetical protein